MIFVFFHAGQDTSIPKMLVQSIRWTNPSAQIIQCAPSEDSYVEGVTHFQLGNHDENKLMTARLEAFHNLELNEPALYLDTDMLILQRITVDKILGSVDALFCKRVFNYHGRFIGLQRGLNFAEYADLPLGEVYPYVACASITRDHTIWGELLIILNEIDTKFHSWYGDQEAIKRWTIKNRSRCGDISETEYGCLPEEVKNHPRPRILHFKGSSRKPKMRQVFNNMKQQVEKANKEC